MTRSAVPDRPLLKPALRRLWRGPHTLQLGVHPRHAIVLTGLAPADLPVLDLLDGTRSSADVVADAAGAGADARGAQGLLDALADAGALDERQRQLLAPDRLSLSLQHPTAGAADRALARRRQATVSVHGLGRVGATVASLLTAAGVGRLQCDDPGMLRRADISPGGVRSDDVGARGERTAATLQLSHLPVEVTASAADDVDVSVVAPVGAHPLPEVIRAVAGRPHLLVSVRETIAMVGPFVVPGRTPCLRCLELARGDRDGQWPLIAAQLVARPAGLQPCDVTLATLAASLAVMQCLAWIDGEAPTPPTTMGGLLEFDLRDGRLRRRTVDLHPDCGCCRPG